MNRTDFEKFLKANGTSYEEYYAFAKGWYDSLTSFCKKNIPELEIVVGEFDPEDEEYQLRYTEFILGLH